MASSGSDLPFGKTVILVVDNLFFSTKISSGLRQRGYSVEAANTLDGIKSKTGQETEAVILDLSASSLRGQAIIKLTIWLGDFGAKQGTTSDAWQSHVSEE